MNIVSQLAVEVEQACRSRNNHFGYGLWSHHIISVVEYSKILAIELGADPEITQIAALLHDYAGVLNYDHYKDHHIHGARLADRLLREYKYPQEKIEIVKECILCHRGSVLKEKPSLEAICLADADAIAHIVNVPSLLYLAFHKHHLSIDDGTQWVRNKLERSWNKLSDHGKALIQKDYVQCESILSQAS